MAVDARIMCDVDAITFIYTCVAAVTQQRLAAEEVNKILYTRTKYEHQSAQTKRIHTYIKHATLTALERRVCTIVMYMRKRARASFLAYANFFELRRVLARCTKAECGFNTHTQTH